MIALAVYDLDRTLWTTTPHTPAGFLPAPYALDGPDALVAANGTRLELFPGARAALDAWTARGVPLSVISANDHDPIAAILATLGLWERFRHPQIAWEDRERGTCNKAILMRALLAALERDGLHVAPEDVVFVDDRAQNIERVSELGVRCVRFGVDVSTHAEVFERLGVVAS